MVPEKSFVSRSIIEIVGIVIPDARNVNPRRTDGADGRPYRNP